MKAIIKTTYGGPEILQLGEVEKPTIADGHILVHVKANSANPADWHILRGAPFFARFTTGLFKPKERVLGADFAGIVQEVGNGVEHFKAGDLVFGESLQGGAFAEFVCIPEHACGLMPEDSQFDEMAGVPIAGLTAYQALITHGKLKKGERVFINGSSGGVGHFAVQIAKAYGAEVTAVCSSKSADFVSALGADEVIAYDKQSIHEIEGEFDLVLDIHGNMKFPDFKRLGKRGILVGFTTMRNMISVLLKNAFSKFSLSMFTAQANTIDLEILADLIKSDSVRVHIEKTYSFEEIPEAISYIEDMHTKGKVVMIWSD